MKTKVTTIDGVGFWFGSRWCMPAHSTKRFRIHWSRCLSQWMPLRLVMAVILCAGLTSSLAQSADQQQKLENLLPRFPDADANKDGNLTIEEAKAYSATHPELRKKRQADGEGGATGAKLADATVLDLYEAREFEGVNYRLLKPIDLPENPSKKYPMILSLHGAAGTGRDNVRNLREWNIVMSQEALRRQHPCFVVVPQSTEPWRTPGMAVHYTDEKIAKMSEDWQEVVNSRRKLLQNHKGGNLDRVYLLLDALTDEFPIDTDRVYILGHSMGGFGTWTAVAEQPDRFAAAITSAGWSPPLAECVTD